MVVSIIGWFCVLVVTSTILIGLFTSDELEIGIEIVRIDKGVHLFTLGISYYTVYESDEEMVDKLELGFFFFNLTIHFYKDFRA